MSYATFIFYFHVLHEISVILEILEYHKIHRDIILSGLWSRYMNMHVIAQVREHVVAQIEGSRVATPNILNICGYVIVKPHYE